MHDNIDLGGCDNSSNLSESRQITCEAHSFKHEKDEKRELTKHDG